MDGVLSDASQRQHFLDGPLQYWEKFFAACGEDAPIVEALEMARLLDPSVVVILLTARPIRVRRQTMDWLGRHPVRWDLLVMRDEDDWTSSHTFKRAELRDLQGRGVPPGRRTGPVLPQRLLRLRSRYVRGRRRPLSRGFRRAVARYNSAFTLPEPSWSKG